VTSCTFITPEDKLCENAKDFSQAGSVMSQNLTYCTLDTHMHITYTNKFKHK